MASKREWEVLISLVASTHQEAWTVGAGQLSLENLVVVSEVGIFKFKHPVARYALNDDNRAEDFHALAKVMTSLLASLHGDSVVSCLPVDFSICRVWLIQNFSTSPLRTIHLCCHHHHMASRS
ncbi:hypothetical protein C2845_PM02G38430 [Panicum miliaceum]|uniref:Uncharacterized protein n=1 Tax=Panicum miliaceum TaxID=4540 RepID=A0A3L6S9S6_PANMI|nr:hypothetical protein C2845_PM02G38430 [Panicum miliaceum]